MDCLWGSTDPRQPLYWVRHYLNGDIKFEKPKSTFKTYGGSGYYQPEENNPGFDFDGNGPGFNFDGNVPSSNGPGFDFGPEPSFFD